MILNPDFKEFIKLLEEHEVRYMIVGGYALAFHGYPRFTQDIDFWIWTDKINAEKLISALEDFGFSSLDIRQEDFQDGDNVVQLGFPPNRIDLITQIDGVQFEEAFNDKEIFEDQGIKMYFVGLDALIKNKKASGRLQDLADLEVLEKIKHKRDK